VFGIERQKYSHVPTRTHTNNGKREISPGDKGAKGQEPMGGKSMEIEVGTARDNSRKGMFRRQQTKVARVGYRTYQNSEFKKKEDQTLETMQKKNQEAV